jgi:hypothetical protein
MHENASASLTQRDRLEPGDEFSMGAALTIAGGTREAQPNIVGQRVLDLPKGYFSDFGSSFAGAIIQTPRADACKSVGPISSYLR